MSKVKRGAVFPVPGFRFAFTRITGKLVIDWNYF